MVKKHFSKSYPFRLSENTPLWLDLQTSTATGFAGNTCHR